MSTVRVSAEQTRRGFASAIASATGAFGAAALLAACGVGGGQEAASGSTAPSALKGKISLSVWGAVYEDELYTAHYIPEFQKQHPEVQVDFIRPKEGEFEERECATVRYGGQNSCVACSPYVRCTIHADISALVLVVQECRRAAG